MKKSASHSGHELFLMEMILAIFFLTVSFAVCIGMFAGAASDRKEAQKLNHIQELALTVGEVLEGCDGTAEAVSELLPGGKEKENTLIYYFDEEWNLCEEGVSSYIMELALQNPGSQEGKKGAGISFRTGEGVSLYETEVYYPVFHKEVQS